MKKFELYERKNYKNSYYLQDILGDFYYFNSLNDNDEIVRNHFIIKNRVKEFKKKIKNVIYETPQTFNSIEEFFQSCIENKRIVTFFLEEYEMSGIVQNFYNNLIILDVLEYSAEQNGISLIPLLGVDEMMWDGMHEKKLEKYSVYNKQLYDISDVFNICFYGAELCEVYRQGDINTFLVGLSKNIDDNYFLIETIDLLGHPNGYVLIHHDVLDYFCFKTKYLSVYQGIVSKNDWTELNSFLEFLKESKQKFFLSDYKGKEYWDNILTDFNEKYIFFSQNGKKRKLLIKGIDVIDTRK